MAVPKLIGAKWTEYRLLFEMPPGVDDVQMAAAIVNGVSVTTGVANMLRGSNVVQHPGTDSPERILGISAVKLT